MRVVERIAVSEELCKGCGICVELCPRKVFEETPGGVPVVVRLEECTACLFCEWHCPDFALGVIWAEGERDLAGAAAAGPGTAAAGSLSSAGGEA